MKIEMTDACKKYLGNEWLYDFENEIILTDDDKYLEHGEKIAKMAEKDPDKFISVIRNKVRPELEERKDKGGKFVYMKEDKQRGIFYLRMNSEPQ
jgi:hypothetical protein